MSSDRQNFQILSSNKQELFPQKIISSGAPVLKLSFFCLKTHNQNSAGKKVISVENQGDDKCMYV